jgi:hypothetical protein
MKAATYEETQAPTESKSVFWQLLRLDAVRRSLRWSVPIALVVGLILRAAAVGGLDGLSQLPFVAHHGRFAEMYIQVWLAVLFAMIIAHFNSRCSSLSLSLPINPRTLWFSRVLSIAGAGLIPIAVLVAATASADPTKSFGLDLPLLPLGARTAAGFILAVVLFQLPSPGVHRIAGKKSYVLYVAVVSAAVITYSIMTPASWLWTAAPVVAALAIGWITGSRLPAGFGMAGAEATSSKAPAKALTGTDGEPFAYGRGRSSLHRRWRLLRIIWHENLNTWPWGLIGMYYQVHHAPQYYLTFMLWCWIFVCQSVRRLNRIDSLPVSRSVVYCSVIGFMAIPAGLGLLTGYLVDFRLKDSPMTAVCYCDRTVRVPYDAWEIAWDGVVPEVSSPWGETYTPHSHRIVKRGLNVAVYNPFEPGKPVGWEEPAEPDRTDKPGKPYPESSPEFIALQIDRAVARVHGPQQVSTRVSDLAGDSSFVNAVARGEYKPEASLHKDSDLRMRTNAVIIILWFVVFAVVNAVWWMRYRPEAEVVRTRWFAILFFALPYVWLFGSIALSARGMINDWAIVAFQMITLRSVAEAIPLSTGLLWALTYAKAEAPAPQSGKHLLSEY